MRTIWKYRLPLVTQAITHVVDMPRGARLLRFAVDWVGIDHLDGSSELVEHPTVWMELDDQAPLQARRFVTVGTGADLGELSADGYVGTYEQGPFVWHIFEPRHADPLPSVIADLPLEAQNAYRLLRTAGYTLAFDAQRDSLAWFSPDDEPLTTEHLVALGELDDHRLGLSILTGAVAE